MCLECGGLLKAINDYIAKADGDLKDELEDEGYADAKKTVASISELEEKVAEALKGETDYFLERIRTAADLEQFASEIWPGVVLDDDLMVKLAEIFRECFEERMPELAGEYLEQTDRELKLERVTRRTMAWIENWSRRLGEIMQLNSHSEIENILTKGLEEGIGIQEFSRRIKESGIRDEWYKARRVAVTEVLRAHSVAQQEAYMQSPAVKKKRWRHTGGYRNKPRKNHEAIDGQVVPVGEPFELEGIKGGMLYPMYPRDSELPPEESINCHCVSQPVVDEDVLGLSLEEREELQRQAVDEMDDEWEKELDERNRARAGIDAE